MVMDLKLQIFISQVINLLTESLYEGTEFETEISYVEYYAMFAYNEGTIQNFGNDQSNL